MKILIIKLGAMGDVLRTTALLPALKEKYEPCGIDWITQKNSLDLLKDNPYIFNVVLIEDATELGNYDLVINLDDDDAACILASTIKAKKLIGAYFKDRKKTYTDDSAPWFDMGLISRHGKEKADRLKAENTKSFQEIHFGMLGLQNYEEFLPQLLVDQSNMQFAIQFMHNDHHNPKKIIIGLNTGAGGRWEGKKLSIEKTVALIDILSNRDAQLMLFGGPDEEYRNKEILQKTKTTIIDAGCHNSLLDFAALVNLCDVLITSDSLAMHMGIALQKQVIAFFCPTSSNEIELYGNGRKIMAKKGCLCCYKGKCDPDPEYDINEMVSAVDEFIQQRKQQPTP